MSTTSLAEVCLKGNITSSTFWLPYTELPILYLETLSVYKQICLPQLLGNYPNSNGDGDLSGICYKSERDVY